MEEMRANQHKARAMPAEHTSFVHEPQRDVKAPASNQEAL